MNYSRNFVVMQNNRPGTGGGYSVANQNPPLVLDFAEGVYRTDGHTAQNFSEVVDFSRTGNATVTDSDGKIKWAPHNLFSYSEDFSNAAWDPLREEITSNAVTAPDGTLTADTLAQEAGQTTVSLVRQNISVIAGERYTFGVWAKANTRDLPVLYSSVASTENSVFFRVSDGTIAGTTFNDPNGAATIEDAGNGWYLCRMDFEVPASGAMRLDIRNNETVGSTNVSDDGGSIYLWGAHFYRSDLGGMQDVPSAERKVSATYLPTTSAARYLPRFDHNPATLAPLGLLIEESRTNELLNSETLSTQSVTVTAAERTISFYGTGTVTLSGASTAGPLVGSADNERVSLTFTPSAGTLTVTVSGSVKYANLELGAFPTSHIPTTGSAATRAAETVFIAAANLPYSSTAMSIAMDGDVSYADNNINNEVDFFDWRADALNLLLLRISTSAGGTGGLRGFQTSGGVTEVITTIDTYSPDVGVGFSAAVRHGSAFYNIAAEGAAGTEDATPSSLPDLSSSNLSLAPNFNGHIKTFRMWDVDLGDAGIEDASS